MIDSKWLQAEIDKLAAEEKEALEALVLIKNDLVRVKAEFATVREKLECARSVKRELVWELQRLKEEALS
jgi:hypothetical protein